MQLFISFSLTCEGEAKDTTHPFTRKLTFAFILRVYLSAGYGFFFPPSCVLYSGLPSASYILHLQFPF